MKLFVSYSRDDKIIVYDLVERLKSEAEHHIWIDRDLSGGRLWWDSILDNIETCECFILFLTPRYIASVHCAAEMNYALALDKIILPLKLKPCERPEALHKIQDLDVSDLLPNDIFLRSARALLKVEKSLMMRGYAAQIRAPRPPMPLPLVNVPVNSPILATSLFSHTSATQEIGSQAQVELSEQVVETSTQSPNAQLNLEIRSVLQGKPATLIVSDQKPMQLIPASSFLFGNGQVRELSDFYIDTWSVTNAEYQRFIVQNNISPPSTWRRGKFPGKKANHPVTGVSWYEAMAYATWAGKRLPTAAEWEKAARGTDGRHYPWGEGFDVQRCNTSEGGQKTTTPVTQYQAGASMYGVLDMAGNVWEWTTDEIKPRGLGRQNQETKRVLKGGSWNTTKGSAECAASTSAWPHERLEDAGFRCVLSLD